MDADKIKWDKGAIEELKHWLNAPVNEDQQTQEEFNSLTFPWPVNIESQRITFSSAKVARVQATLGFDEVPFAEDYEIRITLVPDFYSVPVPPTSSNFSDWILNGSASVVGSRIQLTPAVNSSVGTMVCPITIPSAWTSITITSDWQFTGTADGTSWGLLDSTYFGTNFLGGAGGGAGNQCGVINAGDAWTAFVNHYFGNAVYIYHDAPGSSQTADLAVGGTSIADGAYVLTFTRTGTNLADVDMSISTPGVTHFTKTGVWVPTDPYPFISASCGGLNAVQSIGISGNVSWTT